MTNRLSDVQICQFIEDGFVVLDSGLSEEENRYIDRRLRELESHEGWHGNNIVSRIPELHGVVRSSTIDGAISSLLGPDFLFHPHRAIHRSSPAKNTSQVPNDEADGPAMGEGSTAGSIWHQDAQSPLARARHHYPRHLIGFYFPHDTPKEMGPTRMQAGSQYWPRPPANPTNVVVPDFVPAGTFMLVHFDMVHAGFTNLTDVSRYMIKFVFSRMSNPTTPTWDNKRLERVKVSENESAQLGVVWDAVWGWLRGAPCAPTQQGHIEDLDPANPSRALAAIYAQYDVDDLIERLKQDAHKDKHARKLVKPRSDRQLMRDDIAGFPRRWNERAIVFPNATYALANQRDRALPALLKLALDKDPWMQINAVYALGEIGEGHEPVAAVFESLLDSSHQQIVRQTIDSIGIVFGNVSRNADSFLPKFEELMRESTADWLGAERSDSSRQ